MLHGQGHTARGVGEFHGVAENIDQHLLELQIVADIVIPHGRCDIAGILQPLVGALAADDDVDLAEEFMEGELFAFEGHAAGLDAAHFQDIVDQAQEVPGADADLFQLIPGFRLKIRIPQGDVVQTDDRVHGRSDLMAHIGEETGFRPAGILGEGLFDFRFPLPLLGVGIDIEKNHQSGDDQDDLDQNRYGESVADRLNPFRRSAGGMQSTVGGLVHPDAGGEDNQAEQHNPGHCRPAQAPVFILLQDRPENNEAEDTPGGQNQIGLGGHGCDGNDVRDQELQGEQQGNNHADDAHDGVEPVFQGFCLLPGGGGGEGVGNGGADGGYIHNPADGRAAEEGQEHGDQQNAEDRPAGHPVFVQFSDFSREQLIFRQGGEETAESDIVADKAGEDAAEGGDAEDCAAGGAQSAVSCKEGGLGGQALTFAQGVGIFGPGADVLRQGCDGQEIQHRIGDARGNQSHGHDAEAALQVILCLAGRMGDGFKPHIGPGGQAEDSEGSAQGRLLRGKGRDKGLCQICAGRGKDEADDDAGKEQHGHDDLRPFRGFAPQADQRGEDQGTHCQDHFAHVNMITGDLVMKAELENIAQEGAGDEGQGGGIGPDDGHIGQDEEPGAEEAVIVAETFLCIGIGSAGIRIPVHEEMIIDGDDQHDHRTETETQGGPQRPGQGQEGISRHHKGTPTHSAAEGQRPGAEGGKILAVSVHGCCSFPVPATGFLYPGLPFCFDPVFSGLRVFRLIAADRVHGLLIHRGDFPQLFLYFLIGHGTGISGAVFLRDFGSGGRELREPEIGAVALGGVGRFKEPDRIHGFPGGKQGIDHPVRRQLSDMLVHQLFHPQYAESLIAVFSEGGVEFLQCHRVLSFPL